MRASEVYGAKSVVEDAMGHKDSRMTLRHAHLLPDDLREAYEAIDNEGTASIFSRFLHVEIEHRFIQITSALRPYLNVK